MNYSLAITQHIDFLDFLLRFGCAIFCGIIIGFERQWINRVAGVQTNVLVCGGACIFILSSYFVSYEGQSASRIAAQIVSGIGFLGAGMIFREGVTTHGINTAATVWCAAAIGVLCGMGLTPHALVVMAILITANLFCRKLDHVISGNRKWTDLRIYRTYEIQAIAPQKNNKELRSKIIQVISVEDHNIFGVKTNILKSDMVKITVTFRSHTSEYEKVQKLSETIEEFGTDLIVDWSQV